MTDYTKKYTNLFVRIAYILMAISFVLSAGCATVSEKRYVENNTFISTYPKMAIRVSPELKYLGEYHGNKFKDAQFAMRTANIDQVMHIFLEKGDEGDINRGLVIATFKLSIGFHWLSDSVKKPGSAVDSGEIKINGKVWPYAIWPTTNFFGSAKDFVQKHGFSTNQDFLVGVISKVIDHTQGEALGGTKLAIYYIEDRRISGSDSAQFMDRGLKVAQFLKEGKNVRTHVEPSLGRVTLPAPKHKPHLSSSGDRQGFLLFNSWYPLGLRGMFWYIPLGIIWDNHSICKRKC
jgi:hypothetical protein